MHMNHFRTSLVITFSQFTVFQYMNGSQQIKHHLRSPIIGFVNKLPHEYPNDVRLRILGNYGIRKIL